jgi:hypothetical protein
MKANTTLYLAVLALALGVGIGTSLPVLSADSCGACRTTYLNCLRSAGSNQSLIASCNLNYETCMDRC